MLSINEGNPRYNIASTTTLRYETFSFRFSVVTKVKGGFFMQHAINSSTARLVVTALMTALCLVLNRIVPATPVYHISADFIAVFIVAVLYGPVWSGIAYGVADTIGSILIPFGAYNPGITATLILIGVAYGFVFYKKDMNGKALIIRTVIASVIVFLIKLFLTTLCLWPMFGADGTYLAYVVLRLPNCIAILIAQIICIPLVYKLIVERLKFAL